MSNVLPNIKANIQNVLVGQEETITLLLTGLLARVLGRKFLPLCLAMAVGCAACYALGTLWFMFLTHSPLFTALTLCVLPYLPADALKIALAAFLTVQLDRRLPHGLI